jgi:hypothetical protein
MLVHYFLIAEAFGSVSHDILLSKLGAYGTEGQAGK